MKSLLIPLALLAANAPTQPQQFDLACSGAGVTDDGHGAFKRADIHLRIDLAKKLWCEDDVPPEFVGKVTPCAVLKPIAEIQPGQIWLEKETVAEQEQNLMHWSSVDRETGDYAAVHQIQLPDGMGRDTIALKSHCERAPFSGFPQIHTKF